MEIEMSIAMKEEGTCLFYRVLSNLEILWFSGKIPASLCCLISLILSIEGKGVTQPMREFLFRNCSSASYLLNIGRISLGSRRHSSMGVFEMGRAGCVLGPYFGGSCPRY